MEVAGLRQGIGLERRVGLDRLLVRRLGDPGLGQVDHLVPGLHQQRAQLPQLAATRGSPAAVASPGKRLALQPVEVDEARVGEGQQLIQLLPVEGRVLARSLHLHVAPLARSSRRSCRRRPPRPPRTRGRGAARPR